MKKIIIAALVVTLLFPLTATGQVAAAGLLDDILGDGGAIPVEDINANRLGYWAHQILHLLKVWEDHVRQARLGSVEGGEDATAYLKEQAATRYGEAVTYGTGGPEQWPETFTFDFTWDNGEWLESDLETEERGLDTQRTVLRWLERRQEEFLQEESEAGKIVDAINGADGRNQLLAEIGGALGSIIQESRKEQQLLMAIGNSLAVGKALESNRIVKREAQERAFFNNFNKPVAFPQFEDRGL